MADNVIPSPAPVIPSAQEMQAQVAAVPQTSPVQIDQNLTPLTSQVPVEPAIVLANTPEKELDPKDKIKVGAEDQIFWIKKWLVKGIGIALIFQGLFGLYKSVIFILLDYPELERSLAEHLITQSQVNDFGIRAILIVISTILSMFFALRLTILKTKAAKVISVTIGIFLFIGNAMIHDYFVSLNSSQIIVNGVMTLVVLIRALPSRFVTTNPVLEKATEGGIEAVWYK